MSANATIADVKRTSDKVETVPKRMNYRVLRFLIIGVLLLAVIAKLYQFVVHPPVGSSLLQSRWLSVAAVLLEFILIALWVSRLYPGKTRIFTICCFSIFAVVSLVKWISGEASCGCFGEIIVPPYITFWLDVLIVGSLILTRPQEQHSDERQRKRAISVASIILLGGIGTTVGLLALSSIAHLAANGDIFGTGRVVVFDPAEWKGKKLPILQHIKAPVDLKNGSRVILMIHQDCPDCQKALDEFLAKLKEAGKKESLQHVVIEVPPYREELKDKLMGHKGNCTFGRLSDSQTWFVETPLFLKIKDGILIDYNR